MIVGLGKAFTVTEVAALATQPLRSVVVTEYKPVVVGVIIVVIAPVFQR